MIKKIADTIPPKPTTPPPEGTSWVYDPKSKAWVPQVKSTLKKGDLVVFTAIRDMEPGVIRKIEGHRVWVDIGQTENYVTHISTLEKVQNDCEEQLFNSDKNENIADESKSVVQQAISSIEARNKIEDALKEITANTEISKEFKHGRWEQGYNYNNDTKAGNLELGQRIRKAGTQRFGKIIRINEENNFYRVKWEDTNEITSNWKQELSII